MSLTESDITDDQWLELVKEPPDYRIVAMFADGSVGVRRPDGTGFVLRRDLSRVEVDAQGVPLDP